MEAMFVVKKRQGDAGQSIHILHLEDSSLDADLVRHKLNASGLPITIELVRTREEFDGCISKNSYDLILSDYNLPAFDGLMALELAQLKCPNTPFIFCTGALGEEVAIDMIRRGATDYVLKQRMDRLVPAVSRALSEASERRARRAAESALRRNEQEYRAAIDGVLDYAILAVGSDQKFKAWNRGAERMLGYSVDQAIGLDFAALYPGADQTAEQPARHLKSAFALGELTTNHIYVRRDGSPFPARLVITATRGPENELSSYLVVVSDMTAQTRAAADREALLEREKAARAEAELANRVKDEFLAVASHELRTPLNAILGWASLLKLAPTKKDMDEGVEVIHRNARHQAQLIEDILDVSRMISGRLRLNALPLDLTPIVQRSLETVHTAADAKGVVLLLKLSEIGLVSCDAGRMEQIVWNLVSNAIKFTSRGGEVTVELGRTESKARIAVSDTGVGIDAAFLPFVFDRFQQADSSTTRRHGGLGLGLAIVRHLVELHGGSVQAFSDGKGRGSKFIVDLPLVAVNPGVYEPADRVASQGGFSDSEIQCPAVLQGLKILVLDDDADARRVLQSILETCGASVTCASSVAEAMASLNKFDAADVVVSDIGMPDEDGFVFIKKLRDREQQSGSPRTPAVALTAYTRPSDRTAVLAAGFDAFIAKPVEPKDLLAAISKLAGDKFA